MKQKKNHSPAALPGREITKQSMKFPDCITLHHTYRPCGATGMAEGKGEIQKSRSPYDSCRNRLQSAAFFISLCSKQLVLNMKCGSLPCISHHCCISSKKALFFFLFSMLPCIAARNQLFVRNIQMNHSLI